MGKLNGFQKDMEKHLILFKESRQYLPPIHEKKRWEYLEVLDNLYPPARHGFMQYAYNSGLEFHDFAKHVRSSQVFGFNIIYPIINNRNAVDIFNKFIPNGIAKIDKWFFEYQPEKDELGEWKGKNKPLKYVTSVDFAIFGRDSKNNKIVVMIEVKFTEDKFSVCGGFKSNGNNDKQFCSEEFNKDNLNNRCYLVSKKHRKYFNYISSFYIWNNDKKCPFLENNQCMRNHAFAKSMIKAGVVQKAYFGLLYHDDNECINTLWQRYKNTCAEEEKENLFDIKASCLVKEANDMMLSNYCRDRYRLT